MDMCESYLTITYLKISGASSCRCIKIVGCLRYNRRQLYLVYRKDFGCLIKNIEEGAL